MILFGAVGCYQFFKHLLNSIMFGNSFLSLGRAEMYLIMPPPIYLVGLIPKLNLRFIHFCVFTSAALDLQQRCRLPAV